jgi:uncharacterized protein YecA (UPF0149 family)
MLSTLRWRRGGAIWSGTKTGAVTAFEPMSKRRRGFPSETRVKSGMRVVGGNKEFIEKLGRNDLCPCESGKRFRKCCLKGGNF